jgi:hypothetical protein
MPARGLVGVGVRITPVMRCPCCRWGTGLSDASSLSSHSRGSSATAQLEANRTAALLGGSVCNSSAPRVADVADPPDTPQRACSHEFRRQRSVLGGVPLCRNVGEPRGKRIGDGDLETDTSRAFLGRVDAIGDSRAPFMIRAARALPTHAQSRMCRDVLGREPSVPRSIPQARGFR